MKMLFALFLTLAISTASDAFELFGKDESPKFIYKLGTEMNSVLEGLKSKKCTRHNDTDSEMQKAKDYTLVDCEKVEDTVRTSFLFFKNTLVYIDSQYVDFNLPKAKQDAEEALLYIKGDSKQRDLYKKLSDVCSQVSKEKKENLINKSTNKNGVIHKDFADISRNKKFTCVISYKFIDATSIFESNNKIIKVHAFTIAETDKIK